MGLFAVTGAGGFIGGHLVERLLGDGHRVRALVRYSSTSSIGFLDSARARHPEALEIVHGDVEDPACMVRLIDGCERVLHLAALIGIPYSFVAPHHYVQTNLMGTLNVLEAARAAGVERLVHISTSETYGTAQFVPITEAHPAHAQSPYAATKVGADQLALSYQRSFGLPVVVVRPFNTYGPRQSPRAFIPTVIAQALAGDVIRMGSLDPRRDLNYVTDTVQGMVAAAITPGVEGAEINIGSGVSHSIGDVARAIIERVNPSARIELDPARVRPGASEVMELVAGIERAGELLGYAPSVPLEAGIERVIEHMRTDADLRHAGEYHV
ncbi:MAG: GDP-mannose 4,6-dehydratase [Miltoncostaeaceae bacterium]